MGESQKKKTTTLVLVGKTGSGKSATANSILGRNDFFAKFSFKSVTKECKLSSAVWKDGDGRTLNVVDTPGLFDTSAEHSFVANEIVKCIQLAKDGVHGVLLVTSAVNPFTDEEAAVFDCLQILFGPKITDYVVVVFTRGDELERADTTLKEQLEDSPEKLKNLLRRYNNRKVLFNNKGNSQTKKAQVTELLKQIDDLVTLNGGQPYSNEVFSQFQAMSKKLGSQPSDFGPAQGCWKEEVSRIVATMEDKMEKVVAKLQEHLASEQKVVAKLQEQLTSEQGKVKGLEIEIHKLQNRRCWPL